MKKYNIFEALTEENIEEISNLPLDEEKMPILLSIFELIPEEEYENAYNLFNQLLSEVETVETVEEDNVTEVEERRKITESYTNKLLNGIK